MPVCANGFRVQDVFGRAADSGANVNGVPLNPEGTPPALDDRDFYLYESHQITSRASGTFISIARWQAKANALRAFQEDIGFRILSITTTGSDDVGAFDEDHFWYAWYSAFLYAHAATGWGEFLFSCCDHGNGLAPFRPRPAIESGSAFTGDVSETEPGVFARPTDTGIVRVDATAHTASFEPTSGTAVVEGRDATVPETFTLEQNYPNPFNPQTAIRFHLPVGAAIDLSVYSLSGQRVATLASGWRQAGVYTLRWDGRDDAGRDLGTGVYVYRLESESRRLIRRMLLLH